MGEGLISSRALLRDALAVEPSAQRGREGHKMRCGALNITSLQDKTVLSQVIIVAVIVNYASCEQVRCTEELLLIFHLQRTSVKAK